MDQIDGGLEQLQEDVWIEAGMIGCWVLMLAPVVFAVWAWHRMRRARTRVDRAATYLGRGRDVAGQTRKTVPATASRLGVTAAPGLPIGVTVADDVLMDLLGRRPLV